MACLGLIRLPRGRAVTGSLLTLEIRPTKSVHQASTPERIVGPLGGFRTKLTKDR